MVQIFAPCLEGCLKMLISRNLSHPETVAKDDEFLCGLAILLT